MNVISFYEKLDEFYSDNNYKQVLLGIDEYFETKGNGIFDVLLDMYINSLLKLGLLDKASKNIGLMRKLFPGYYDNFKLAFKYSLCGEETLLEEIMKNASFSEIDYYHIARACFFNGNHKKAKELFNYYILNENNEKLIQKAREYLRKIAIYEDNQTKTFVETSYSYFKYQGKKLLPGHIVYVDKLRDEYIENQLYTDPKKNTRPYMIWRIEGNKLYAFPVSTQIGKNDYVLFAQHYRNRYYDRIIKNNLVCLQENDIQNVIDKVRDDDYNSILYNLYQSICLMRDIPKEATRYFMSTMSKKIKVKSGNIIVVPDFNEKHIRSYFVLDVDSKKGKYNVVEVIHNDNNEYQIKNMQLITVSMKASILRVVDVEESVKSKLLEQMPTNFKKVNMLGKIVEFGSKRLEIMIEEEAYYICIDRTFQSMSSYISVELLRKDMPLIVVDKVSDDTYEQHMYTLREYLKKNSNKITARKKRFLKGKK